jgi:Leucine-rich repeat (LRR) protein
MKILYAIALIVGVINMNTAAHANKLDLSCKNLQAIPAKLYEESALEELWLDDNQIMQLPEEIQHLSTLKRFSIYKNQQTDFLIFRSQKDADLFLREIRRGAYARTD